MGHGGNRAHPKDCTCGACPRIGRPKNQPEASDNGKMGKGFWTRVFARVSELGLKDKSGQPIRNAEDYALSILGQNDAEARSLFRLGLAYQFGKPVQPTITADTRETVPDLDFGNLIMPARPEPGKAGKPN